MKATPNTKIPEIILLEPKVFGDHRGFFMDTWNQKVFNELGIKATFVQDSHSLSAKGILRGLHYQLKYPQGKLVRVTSGEVFDIVLDIRANSATCGQWIGERLSAENKKMFWIPPGFAHGFYVLSDEAEVVYKFTNYYMPQDERGIRWDDPDINITWPLINNQAPTLSEKDQQAQFFKNAEKHT